MPVLPPAPKAVISEQYLNSIIMIMLSTRTDLHDFLNPTECN